MYKIRYTIKEMQAMTGLGNKVSMRDMSIIEDKVLITHGKKKALKDPIRIGFVVFDMRLNLRRLPGAMPPPPDEAPAATTPVKPALFSPVRPRPPPAQPRASPPWRDLTPTGLGAVPCR